MENYKADPWRNAVGFFGEKAKDLSKETGDKGV